MYTHPPTHLPTQPSQKIARQGTGLCVYNWQVQVNFLTKLEEEQTRTDIDDKNCQRNVEVMITSSWSSWNLNEMMVFTFLLFPSPLCLPPSFSSSSACSSSISLLHPLPLKVKVIQNYTAQYLHTTFTNLSVMIFIKDILKCWRLSDRACLVSASGILSLRRLAWFLLVAF